MSDNWIGFQLLIKTDRYVVIMLMSTGTLVSYILQAVSGTVKVYSKFVTFCKRCIASTHALPCMLGN